MNEITISGRKHPSPKQITEDSFSCKGGRERFILKFKHLGVPQLGYEVGVSKSVELISRCFGC